MRILPFWCMHREKGVWAFTHPPPSYSCADVSRSMNICSENVFEQREGNDETQETIPLSYIFEAYDTLQVSRCLKICSTFTRAKTKKHLELASPRWCYTGHHRAEVVLTWAGGGGCCTKPWGGGGCSTCWDTGGPEPVKPPGGSCWLGEVMM